MCPLLIASRPSTSSTRPPSSTPLTSPLRSTSSPPSKPRPTRPTRARPTSSTSPPSTREFPVYPTATAGVRPWPPRCGSPRSPGSRRRRSAPRCGGACPRGPSPRSCAFAATRTARRRCPRRAWRACRTPRWSPAGSRCSTRPSSTRACTSGLCGRCSPRRRAKRPGRASARRSRGPSSCAPTGPTPRRCARTARGASTRPASQRRRGSSRASARAPR